MIKAINLIWIIPLCVVFGWFVALNFVTADIDITMDDNTRIAIQSLNESIGEAYEVDYLLEIKSLEKDLETCKLVVELQRINPNMNISVGS